jgi:predicted DNA-binding transcriptional regulator YafY
MNVTTFASGKRKKSTNDASEAVIRKIWVLIELLRNKHITFEHYEREYERDFRSFQRDLQQLRTIGQSAGFGLSKIQNGSRVVLEHFDGKITKLQTAGSQTEQLIGDVARAFGGPIVTAIGSLAGERDDDDRFFHFATPTLVESESSSISAICETLKAAWSAKAYVRFRYADPKKPGGAEREVEPYRVLIRSGAFYLVGYDRQRRGWRLFALDRFAATPVRIGSILARRELPEQYASDDVLGFFKSASGTMDVTVELSARVAPAVISRRWQSAQRVKMQANGQARVTFAVGDPAEVVRWTLGFGADARIVAPADAVKLAKTMIASIAATYDGPKSRRD